MRTAVAGMFVLGLGASAQAEKLHFTYLWHMEQPIYWPDQQVSGVDRYERAWESILRTDAGAAHPSNNLRDIFGKPDRVAAYQFRVKDSIQTMLGRPEAGAQVSFSGGLIENLQSLGAVSQLGYSPGWFNDYRTARNWTTSAGKPRCDLVLFGYHHPLGPLVSESTLRKEIQLQKAVYDDAWGASPGISRGFFPSEMAFTTRMIKVLDEEGIDWSFVSGEKISRACADYPVVYGSGGVNCDPPNPADQINPAQGSYYRVQISRGCAPVEAYPYAFTPHRAQHVDPDTGQIHEIVVVPCAQAIGWEDGFGALGTGHFDAIEPGNNPSRPMLAVLAHDGDNAFGGGFSYYMEATPNLVNAASAAGYTATTVEQYLNDHPVPAGDVVHVEDGAWVNADSDFGSPQFWNWNYPPVDAQGQVDIENGWAEDIRNWAVITAAQNYVDTAEQVHTDAGGTVDVNSILYPSAASNGAERSWHYFLGSLNSGYMYFGTAEDFEVKPAVACNESIEHASPVISSGADATAPEIWIPQRWPWNPGETNFGAPYGYQQTVMPTDMWVWTFVHDVSGVQSVTLRYRVDGDGTNPLASTQNETYAGGPEVGAWQSLAMTTRAFPAGNVYNDPGIDFFEMPVAIADQYHAKITGLSDVLVDYYVEAVDATGNVRKSPIQHVWIGDGEGSTGGGDPSVAITPDPAVAGQNVLIQYDATGGPLASAAQVFVHYGFDNWATVNPTDPAMTFNATQSVWEVTLPVSSSATQLDMVFNDGAGTWDNNNGQDWHFVVTGSNPGGGGSWQIDGQLDNDATQIAQNNVTLWAGVKGTTLYLATDDAGEGSDHFIFLAQSPGAMQPAQWGKSGQVAAWDAFLADENDNDFEGWFDASGAAEAATGPNGGVLEGTIDLGAEFGSIPTEVYASVALFATPDGGALLATHQIAPSVNSDGNIDPAEYQLIDLCAIGLDCCAADLTTTGAGAGDPGFGTPDGSVTSTDLNYYINAWVAQDAGIADLTTTGAGMGDPGFGTPDASVTSADLNYYVNLWVAGCP